MDRGGELLLAVAVPADRSVEAFGHGGRDDGLGVGVDLGAEAPTYIAGEHANPVLSHAQHTGSGPALHVRCLGRKPEGVLLDATVVGGSDGAGFHRVGYQAWLDDAQRQGAVGLGEGGIGVADGA